MEILVNHLTRMSGSHVCVAGLDEDGRHIRPVAAFGRLAKEIVAEFGGPFRLGTLVELGAVVPRPDPPEVEDHVFIPAHARQLGMADEDEFWGSLEVLSADSLIEIFGETMARDGSTASMPAGTGRVSLGVYRPRSRVRLDRSYGKLRIRISDPDLGPLSLPLTDLRLYDLVEGAVRDRRAELLEDRLRRRTPLLSVGVGRPWAREGGEPRHWLQVNNVHLDDNPFWPD